jgi:hypothetical protein
MKSILMVGEQVMVWLGLAIIGYCLQCNPH